MECNLIDMVQYIHSRYLLKHLYMVHIIASLLEALKDRRSQVREYRLQQELPVKSLMDQNHTNVRC